MLGFYFSYAGLLRNSFYFLAMEYRKNRIYPNETDEYCPGCPPSAFVCL